MSWLNDNDRVVFKALTILAIEKTLLDVGKPAYDKVISVLSKNYHCYLPECYEHPEYLNEVLKKLFGNSHIEIVKSINKQMEEYSHREPVGRFLEIINK